MKKSSMKSSPRFPTWKQTAWSAYPKAYLIRTGECGSYPDCFLSLIVRREEQQIASVQVQPNDYAAHGKSLVMAPSMLQQPPADSKDALFLAASTIAQTLARADWSVQFLGQVKAGMLEQGYRETNPVWLREGQTMFYSIKPCAAVLRAPPSCLNPLKLCFLKHDNRALKECGCRYPSCCNEPSIGRGLSRACGGRWERRWVKRHF